MTLRAMRFVAVAFGLYAVSGAPVTADDAPPQILQFQFDSTMARKMGEVCETLRFNDAAYQSYLADVTDASGAELETPAASALVPFYEAFIQKHGGAIYSSRSAFCRAGDREVAENTRLGQMLLKGGS